MKKRFSALVLAAALTLALAVPAGAAEVPALQVDGVTLDYVPELVDGVSYLPAGELAAALGASAEAEGDRVTLTKNGESAVLNAAFRREGTAYLPIRAAGNALGFSVGWDRAQRTVLLADVRALAETVAQAGSPQTWRLAGTGVEAGPFSQRLAGAAARMAAGVDPGCPVAALLSAIPLTDAGSSWSLVSQAAAALSEGEERVSLSQGETVLTLIRTPEGGSLDVELPSSALAPAELLRWAGLAGKRAEVRLTISQEEAGAVVSAGGWRAQARWTVC